MGGDLPHQLDDGQVLGTHTLALAAGDAVGSSAVGLGELCIVCEVDGPALLLQILAHVLVVQGEVARDGDVHGTSVRAVGAAGAGHGDLPVDDVGGGVGHGDLLGREGLKVRHKVCVVAQLLDVAHAGQDHHHVLLRGREADRPGGDGGVGIGVFEHPFGGLRQLCKRPALDGLHHHDGFMVLCRRLIHRAGLDPFALPVEVVELDLYKFHLRVLCQDLVQQLRRVVEGKARVLDEPLRLLVQQPVEAVKLLVLGVTARLDAVQEVVVEVARAGLLELLVEDAVAILEGVEEGAVELGRQGEALARVAVDNGGFGGLLTLEAVIHDGGVKVGEASADEEVHHLLELFDIDARVVVGVEKGQAHQAEAEFFHRITSFSYLCNHNTKTRRRQGNTRKSCARCSRAGNMPRVREYSGSRKSA